MLKSGTENTYEESVYSLVLNILVPVTPLDKLLTQYQLIKAVMTLLISTSQIWPLHRHSDYYSVLPSGEMRSASDT